MVVWLEADMKILMVASGLSLVQEVVTVPRQLVLGKTTVVVLEQHHWLILTLEDITRQRGPELMLAVHLRLVRHLLQIPTAEQVTRILMAGLFPHQTHTGDPLKVMIHICEDLEDPKICSREEWTHMKALLPRQRIPGAMIVPQLEQRLDTAIHGTSMVMEAAVVAVLYVYVISGETTKIPEGHLPLHLVDVNGLGRGTHSK